MNGPRLKIGLVCSHGGHLTEMLQLAPAFEGHDTFYFCYDAETTRGLERAYRVPNMARNPVEFAKNLARLLGIFWKERPDLLVSTGAEIALPAFAVGKLFGAPMVYIECGAQVARPSFTGRLLSRCVRDFYVQWPELLPTYGRRASLRGSFIEDAAPFPGDRSAEARARITLLNAAPSGPKPCPAPPLDLGLFATRLQQAGCAVRVVDAAAEDLGPAATAALLGIQAPDALVVRGDAPGAAEALVARVFSVNELSNEAAWAELLEAISDATPGPDKTPRPDWSLFPLRAYRAVDGLLRLPMRADAKSLDVLHDEWRFNQARYAMDEAVLCPMPGRGLGALCAGLRQAIPKDAGPWALRIAEAELGAPELVTALADRGLRRVEFAGPARSNAAQWASALHARRIKAMLAP